MSTRNEIFAGFLDGMNYEEVEEEIEDEAESQKLLFILLSVSVLGFVLLLGELNCEMLSWIVERKALFEVSNQLRKS